MWYAGSDVMGCRRPTGGVFSYVSSDRVTLRAFPVATPRGRSSSSHEGELVGYQSDIQLAQELNTFYTRFDVVDFSSEINVLWNKTMCNMKCNFCNQQDVINFFLKSKVGKSSGPDKIGGRLLKTCADQLGPVFFIIYYKSCFLSSKTLWKEAIVVPVRETSCHKGLTFIENSKSFRSIAVCLPG